MNTENDYSENINSIAIIGMAGKFPNAKNIDEFWDLLKNGKEGISKFDIEHLKSLGEVHESVLNNPNFIPTRGLIQDLEYFDADFFGFFPREAEAMDPQIRIFLECAWSALEHTGIAPNQENLVTGVFTGASDCEYLYKNLINHEEFLANVGGIKIRMLTSSQFISTLASYKLNLSGPSFSIQCGCSSSLVALHQACQSLLIHDCDIALSGGSSVGLSNKNGYIYLEGGIMSSDGYCRPFDEFSSGTVAGDGAAVLVLKRLNDAIINNDNIIAVIRGTSVNNDGNKKVGFSSPSVEGQKNVILQTLSVAGKVPSDISYVETHGTATKIGDSIEIAALKEVFAKSSIKCGLGSVKSNIGHLNAASGIAGMVKCVLALQNKKLPKTIYFNKLNPELDLENTQLYIVKETQEWQSLNGENLVCGVSSFGVGGTNAHAILEEAKLLNQPENSFSNWQLILVSGKTENALLDNCRNLFNKLNQCDDITLPGVAYTLQIGRTHFIYRFATVVSSLDALKKNLQRFLENSCSVSPNKKTLLMIDSCVNKLDLLSLKKYFADFPNVKSRFWENLKHVAGVDFTQPIENLIQSGVVKFIFILSLSEFLVKELNIKFDLIRHNNDLISQNIFEILYGSTTIKQAIVNIKDNEMTYGLSCFNDINQSSEELIFNLSSLLVINIDLFDYSRADSYSHSFLNALANFWTNQMTINWSALWENIGSKRPRITPLPTYSFQRKKYWKS